MSGGPPNRFLRTDRSSWYPCRLLLLFIFEDAPQDVRFAVREVAKFAGKKISQHERSKFDPFQLQHRMADDFKHALDLVLSTFIDRHFEPGVFRSLPHLFDHGRGRHPILQLDATCELADFLII